MPGIRQDEEYGLQTNYILMYRTIKQMDIYQPDFAQSSGFAKSYYVQAGEELFLNNPIASCAILKAAASLTMMASCHPSSPSKPISQQAVGTNSVKIRTWLY
jgi:hypothetical protein